MMDQMNLKQRLIDELLEHIDDMQGGDLKDLVDQAKAKSMGSDAGIGSDDSGDSDPMADPKGIAIEKVAVSKPKPDADMKVDDAMDGASQKEPDGDEMSDEELAELLKHLC